MALPGPCLVRPFMCIHPSLPCCSPQPLCDPISQMRMGKFRVRCKSGSNSSLGCLVGFGQAAREGPPLAPPADKLGKQPLADVLKARWSFAGEGAWESQDPHPSEGGSLSGCCFGLRNVS